MLGDKIQIPSDNLFWFSIGGYVMDQIGTDGRFIGGIKILAVNCRREFSKFFEMLDARIASAVNKIIWNSPFKKVSLEEQKAQKEDRFLRRNRPPSRFMITFELLLLTIPFSITLFFLCHSSRW